MFDALEVGASAHKIRCVENVYVGVWCLFATIHGAGSTLFDNRMFHVWHIAIQSFAWECKMPTNETPTVAAILADTKSHGFEFYTDRVSKGDASWNVPLVRHLDVDLLRATFGDAFFLTNMDGTSRHVTNQRIARDMKADNATVKDLAIMTAIVENMLGMKTKKRTVVSVPDFSYGGVSYTNAAERDEAARRDLIAQGFPENMIDAFISRLSNTVQK